MAVQITAVFECDKERRVETVSQQRLARYAPPDSRADKGASPGKSSASSYVWPRDHRAVLQLAARHPSVPISSPWDESRCVVTRQAVRGVA